MKPCSLHLKPCSGGFAYTGNHVAYTQNHLFAHPLILWHSPTILPQNLALEATLAAAVAHPHHQFAPPLPPFLPQTGLPIPPTMGPHSSYAAAAISASAAGDMCTYLALGGVLPGLSNGPHMRPYTQLLARFQGPHMHQYTQLLARTSTRTILWVRIPRMQQRLSLHLRQVICAHTLHLHLEQGSECVNG